MYGNMESIIEDSYRKKHIGHENNYTEYFLENLKSYITSGI